MKKILLILALFVCFVVQGQTIYTSSKDFMLSVPMGTISNMSSVNKFGQNASIASGSEEDIWDGSIDYVFPSGATITHIRSAVNSATTQSSTIEVQGLDVNWDLVVQTKDLDGSNSTTEVALDTPLRRIFRMKVLEDAVMDEDIWAGDDDFVVGDAKAIIQEGNNQTLMAIYTVPNGCTAYIVQVYASTTESTGKEPKSTEIRLWVEDNVNSYAFQLKQALGIPKAGSMIIRKFEPYMKVTEKSDIKISAYCDSEIGNISAGFDLILVIN